MKFKVTKKDFMLFCIYCGILLYFCAIAVLNFSSFSTDGTFYGLLPFKAFTPQYIGFTLGLFVAALILIFTSVSSKIVKKKVRALDYSFLKKVVMVIQNGLVIKILKLIKILLK